MGSDRHSNQISILKALQVILRLSLKDISSAGGVSRVYTCRLLKGQIQGSDEFYANLNKNLLKYAKTEIFALSDNVPAQEVLDAVATIKRVA